MIKEAQSTWHLQGGSNSQESWEEIFHKGGDVWAEKEKQILSQYEENGWLKLDAKKFSNKYSYYRSWEGLFEYGLNWSRENPLKGRTD